MDAKLTLKLNEAVIERAKHYARSRKTSLSNLIENYLDMLTHDTGKGEKEKITPLVKSLSGVIKLPKGYDHKTDYGEYLTKKYK